jgi:hypothetical protein
VSGIPTLSAFFSPATPAPRNGRRNAFPQSVLDGPGEDFSFDHPNYTGALEITASTALADIHCGLMIVCNSASPLTVTLPNPIPFYDANAGNWWVRILNVGAGVVTVDRNGLDINGGTANPALTNLQGAIIDTDDAGWFALVIGASGGGTPGGSHTQVQYNASGTFGGVSGATSDGTTLFVTTQPPLDDSTKAASTAYVDAALALLTTPVDNEIVVFTGTSGTLTHTPVTGTQHLFRNGARQTPGAGNDYTISGAAITLAIAAAGSDAFLSDYSYPGGGSPVGTPVNNEIVAFTGTSGTLANTPVTGTQHLFRNGVRQTPGAGNDYTISGANITLAVTAGGSDAFLADYWK